MTNSQKQQIIRVRLAPSPTGPLHLGTARTGLFNFLFAQQNKGKFILRIEDTDIERSQKEYEKDIIENLKWLNLKWDEGPFRQSERKAIYQQYIQKLLDSGQAFWCYHSKDELDQEKKNQIQRKEAPRHLCSHQNKPPKNKKGGIIRFRSPEKKIIFDDLIRGRVEFDASLLGDFSIARDQKTPLYNLGVVIDDYEMKITHIIRGEDHISNTPKQILIAQALGLPQPQYAHLPLILGPDRSKLSKRHGAVSVGWYREKGYLPEAMINFMALLGWNPGTEKEIFSLDELIDEFSLTRVQKGGAIFNIQKLDWLNAYYIRQMPLDRLTEECLPYLERAGLILSQKGKGFKIAKTGEMVELGYLEKIIALEQERMKQLSQIGDLTKFFFINKIEYKPELLLWKKMTLNGVRENLEMIQEILSEGNHKFDRHSLEKLLMPIAQKRGVGELLWPLRVALTGEKASPGPFEIMEILGKEKTLARIQRAIAKAS